MTKAELIDRLKHRTGLRKQELVEILDAILEEMAEAFVRQERIELRGFGVFIPVKRKRRKSEDKIPRIKFKLSQVIRQRMITEENRKRREK
ncbi:MAG: HU family DNA-binding protein [candidate division WOR-3 bacterium]